MASITSVAKDFFAACDAGKGWEACKKYCRPDAGFAAQAEPRSMLAMVAVFYRTGALVFGGGHVVLPLLRDALVPSGWISDNAFLSGYGAAQAVPGPLFTFAAYLGATPTLRRRGTSTAAAPAAPPWHCCSSRWHHQHLLNSRSRLPTPRHHRRSSQAGSARRGWQHTPPSTTSMAPR